VKMAHDVPELRKQIQQEAARGSTWSDNELDTAAKQNLYYNSHQPITIE